MPFFTIIEKSISNAKKLIKKQIREKKILLTNFIFLKVIMSTLYAFGANHLTQQFNIISTIYSKKKRYALPYTD